MPPMIELEQTFGLLSVLYLVPTVLWIVQPVVVLKRRVIVSTLGGIDPWSHEKEVIILVLTDAWFLGLHLLQ